MNLRISWAGRLLRVAICGLLAAAALPAIASADLGSGVSISTPVIGTSVNVSVPTPSVTVPDVSTGTVTSSLAGKTATVSAILRSRSAAGGAATPHQTASAPKTRSHHHTPTRTLAAVMLNQDVPFSGPVTDDCTGMPFLMTGTMHTLMSFTTSDTSGTHVDFNIDTHDTGLTNVTTGAHLVSSDVVAVSTNFGSGATEFTQDARFHFVISGESTPGLPFPPGLVGVGDDEFVYTQIHMTINAGGVPTASVTNFRASCN